MGYEWWKKKKRIKEGIQKELIGSEWREKEKTSKKGIKRCVPMASLKPLNPRLS